MSTKKNNATDKLLKTIEIKLIKVSEQVTTLKFISSGDNINDNTLSCLNYYYTPLGCKIMDKRVTGECKRILHSTVREYITFAEFCKLCSEPKYAKIIISLSDILGKIPFPFYWECAPIKQLTDPMKIYLIKAEFTTRNADTNTFANQITAKNKDDYALHFPSVTGSSELIIPNALKSDNATKFTHMRNFMKYTSNNDNTGAKMRLAFWYTVAHAAQQFLKKHGIIYLKTHGHGVNYFHFRLQKTNAYRRV